MANNRRLAQVGSFVGRTSSDKLAFTANTGIGTTNPRFTLEVGAVGASGTSLFVNGDAFVSGALTATSFFGNVTGDITGNADTATALQTARDFSVSGDVTTSSAVSFDGTGNVGLAVTLTETGVAAGSYGASNLIPRITVDSKGRITNVAQNSFAIIQDTSPELGGNLNLNSRNVTGTGNFNVSGVITATTFVKSGGTSSQFLKADGTVDSNTYLTAEAQTLDGVLTLGNTSSNGMSVGVTTASSFVKSGGTSSEFLKADGTVDSNTYLTAESDTLDDVTSRGNSTANGISVGVATASSFVKSGGTSSQFLKADGTVDSNTYLTAESQTLDGVLTLGNTSSNGMSVGVVTASSFIRSGGTSSQFLKADGTVDSSTYLTSALQNVVEDTTPQLGGDLDLNNKNVTGTGSISITGTLNVSGVSTFQDNVNVTGNLAVDANTLFVNATNNRIGIGTTNPAYQVEIENTGANALLVLDRTDGAACFIEGQATRSAFGSVNATPLALAYNSFAVVTIGAGGSIRVNPDGDGYTFPTTDGSANQVLQTDGNGNISFATLSSGISNVVEDTTPQLGGDLDLNNKNVTGTGSISITGGVSASGVVTATSGFNLGISSAGTSITSGSPVTTLNFVGTGNTFAFNGTTVDISIAGGAGGGGGVSEVETTVSTTNATGVGSFAVATYRSADVIAQISQGSNYQVGRYLMIHDGTTVTVVEESSIATGSMLGSFNGVINGANAELRVTLVSAGTAATVTTKIDTVTIP